MAPGRIPRETPYGGDRWSRRLTIKDDQNPPVAVDLTADWSGWAAQWRPVPGGLTHIDLTVDDTDAATGILVVSATGAQTAQMVGPGVWDLQGTSATYGTRTVVRQDVEFEQDVTR